MLSNLDVREDRPTNASMSPAVRTQDLSGVVFDTHEVYDVHELYEDALGEWEYPHQNVIKDEIRPVNLNTRTL